MNDKKTPTGLLYCGSYGGFELSKKCKDLYEKETGDKEIQDCLVSFEYRKDPILIKYYFEKGSKWMSTDFSSVQFYPVPADLLEWVSFSEYDGMETPYINIKGALDEYTKAFLNNVKDDKSNLESEFDIFKSKVDKIEKVYNDYRDKKLI